MASAWITRRQTASGHRYRVLYRTGGRDTAAQYAGSFERKRDAEARRNWVIGELAAMRLPDVRALEKQPPTPTVREAAKRWQASRVDIAENTKLQHRSAINRVLPLLGESRIDELTPGDVADLVAELAEKGKARESICKAVQALAMVLDHAGISPNPARDRVHVKLPRETRAEIVPPTAAQVLAVHNLLPARYRLPLIVLDSTGMRLGELEQLAWGDVDEPRGRWRVSQAVAKTGRGRWVEVSPAVFEAVLDLVPREDRTPERRVFQGFGGDRFRTAITRACTTAGVPTFSPHDLRHRRISLLHLGGVPWARIGEHVGQRNIAVTANTYTHVLADETELDHRTLLLPRGE
jgi:integrase